MTKQWLVMGWHSTEKIFEERYPLSAFSQKQMETLLQRFVCRDLSYEEIAGVTRRQRSASRLSYLDVSMDPKPPHTLSAGLNPYYTAIVEGVA